MKKEFFFPNLENITIAEGYTVLTVEDHRATVDIGDPTAMRLVELYGGQEPPKRAEAKTVATTKKAVSDGS